MSKSVGEGVSLHRLGCLGIGNECYNLLLPSRLMFAGKKLSYRKTDGDETEM